MSTDETGALATQGAASSLDEMVAKGLRQHQAGHPAEAEALYRQALAADPNHAEALHLLGMIAYGNRNLPLAVELIVRAITNQDPSGLYHSNLGSVLFDLGRMEEAVACYRVAIARNPAYAPSYYNLGNAFRKLGRPDEAASCLRLAIARRPDFAAAHNNLGALLRDQGDIDGAAASFRRAVELDPHYVEAQFNLGETLQQQGRLDEAVECHRATVGLRPDFAEAHAGLATALLARGDMAEGWRELEWRLRTQERLASGTYAALPQWRGEPAEGRTLLLHAEGGFGDTLQFCRYAPLAAARGLRVILHVPDPLIRLLRSLPNVDQVLGEGEDRPDFDLYCPMFSLPFAFGTTLATIPAAPSYLSADSAQVTAWAQRLRAAGNRAPRVGLVWAGTPGHSAGYTALDKRRSLHPSRLAPLSEVPGLQFFSLQKHGPPPPEGFPLIDHMNEMRDFADTAALITNLDLVISVDTAVAHLAAALGKPVWLLERFDSCSRWLVGRRDSPWYPTMRLYRQRHAGDWDPVLAEVVRDLHCLAGVDAVAAA